MLLQGKAGTVGYCYAFAKFGTANAAQYLVQYLEKELRRTEEAFQDTALYSLKYIDKSRGLNYAESILTSNGLWDNFVRREHGIMKFKLSKYDRWNSVDKHFDNFIKMFDFIDATDVRNGIR
jgi:hypothetical protein